MQKSPLTLFYIFLVIIFMNISCGTEDEFNFEVDLSTVPESFDITDLQPSEEIDGIKIYNHKTGEGNFKITVRDQVRVFLSLRNQDNEIIYSTYANGNENSVPVSMRLADGQDPNIHRQFLQRNNLIVAYTPGFKEAMIDLQEGDVKTFVIEPEKGYLPIPNNNINELHRNDTLIYDVKVSTINPKKSVN